MADATTSEFSEPDVYEVGYLVVPTVLAEALSNEVAGIKDLLARYNAMFLSEEFPRERQLAYMMRKSIGGRFQKFTAAYFGWIKFEATNTCAVALKETLKENEHILRFLLVRTVRTTTPSGGKSPAVRRSLKETRPRGVPVSAKPPLSEAELDKKIEELVAE